ncbi:MAG TPA: DUF1365 family protein, partial [Gammaproteobacteria bacterium]|nr:DUF1365 family protein [Gammaproteobacteria bacterium]
RKVFHVSPFIPAEAEYRFRFRAPEERAQLYITEYTDNRPLLKASVGGKRVPLTDARLISMFARLPFMTLKIVAMIHWQALKIWRRGGRFHPMPGDGLYQGSERVTQGWSVHSR